MDKNQALVLITQAVVNYRGTLQEHQTLQQALDVIRKELQPKKEEVKK